MAVAGLCASIVSVLVAIAAVLYARQQARTARNAVKQAQASAEAATRSADIAEVVERGRHHGWRIEGRTNDPGARYYTLRNVGTVNARNVTLAGEYMQIHFQETASPEPVDIAAGQARLFLVIQTANDADGEVHITWTPDLPDAEPMTWTEVPPIARA